MINEEKMTHILNLMVEALAKQGYVEFPDRGRALLEGKKICLLFVKDLQSVGDTALKKVRSQKNAPPEGSPQWETLYNKYFEEEMRKKGG